MPRDSPLHCRVTDEATGFRKQLDGGKKGLRLICSIQLDLQWAAAILEKQLNDEELGRHFETSGV